MEFQCDPTSRVPIYRQLMDQIRQAVARGRLRPATRLPSGRQLSRGVGGNPNTGGRGDTQVGRESVLNTRQGLGVFVAEPSAELSAAARRERFAESLDRFLTEAVHLGFSAEEVVAAVAKRMKGFQFVGTAGE